jgi:hypothetical protein
MTQTFIALLSITFGIIGTNIFAYFSEKFSLGIIGNTIAGVFGSIFIVKTLGRLGFDPNSIVSNGATSWFLLPINLLASVLGGILLLLIIIRFKRMMD